MLNVHSIQYSPYNKLSKIEFFKPQFLLAFFNPSCGNENNHVNIKLHYLLVLEIQLPYISFWYQFVQNLLSNISINKSFTSLNSYYLDKTDLQQKSEKILKIEDQMSCCNHWSATYWHTWLKNMTTNNNIPHSCFKNTTEALRLLLGTW